MSTSMPTVAVVVLNWNGVDLLQTFLPTWLEHTPDGAELIIVDNGSTDSSVNYIRSKYPSIRLIEFPENYGFAEGYNRAIELIEHEIVVLLNSDVALTAGWLDEPLKLLHLNTDIAAVQPKIRAYSEPTRFEYAGAAGGYIDRLGYPFCRGRILDTIEKDFGQYDTPVDIFWASGACLIIRREVYLSLGGLDSRFFAHQEEIDLCWRVLSRGYRIVFAPNSLVYHLGGGTLSMNSPRKTYLNFRNNLLMLYKNLPNSYLFWVLTQRLLLDSVAALQYLLRRQPLHARAVLQAYQDYYRMRREMQDDRARILDKAICRYPKEIVHYSLIWRYFVRRQRVFSNLD